MAEKVYFKIGEIARKFNVSTSLIRYWEQQFDFIKPRKNAKGRRYYTRKDLDRITIVYHLIKERGMTIQGTREYFEKYHSDKAGEKVELIATLKKTKEFLQDIKSMLEEELRKRDEEEFGDLEND